MPKIFIRMSYPKSVLANIIFSNKNDFKNIKIYLSHDNHG